MFRAFMDESVSPGLFVMAGYIATDAQWEAFSAEWQRHLEYTSAHFRKIDWFHLEEMTSPGDLERARWFYEVIGRHVLCSLEVAIDLGALERICRAFGWENIGALRNPYMVAFHEVLTEVPLIQENLGINSPIDFCFDETPNRLKCMEGWEIMKEHLPLDARRFLGNAPIFRDDKEVSPLQAADLWAGVVRRSFKSLLEGGNYELAQNWPLRVPAVSIILGEDRLRSKFHKIRRDARTIAAIRALNISGSANSRE